MKAKPLKKCVYLCFGPMQVTSMIIALVLQLENGSIQPCLSGKTKGLFQLRVQRGFQRAMHCNWWQIHFWTSWNYNFVFGHMTAIMRETGVVGHLWSPVVKNLLWSKFQANFKVQKSELCIIKNDWFNIRITNMKKSQSDCCYLEYYNKMYNCFIFLSTALV